TSSPARSVTRASGAAPPRKGRTMKAQILRPLVACAVVAAATFAVTRAVYSQDLGAGNGHDGPAGKPPEEVMKAMQERAATNEEHTKLASLVGTWDAEMNCPTMGRSKGTLTTESVLGGRVLLSRFSADMNGQPYEGVELRGYDKDKKQFWVVWCDNT